MSAIHEPDLQLGTVDEALAKGWTIPASWYSDPSVYASSSSACSAGRGRSSPRAAASRTGRSHRRAGRTRGRRRDPRPRGSAATGSSTSAATVRTRSRSPTANQRSLQCRYHGWTYDLDGALRSAPRCGRELEFPLSELGLMPSRSIPGRASSSSTPTSTRCRCARPTRARRARREDEPRLQRLHVPSALDLRDSRQLEGLGRERDRVLPLPDRASRQLQRCVRHRRGRLRADRVRNLLCQLHAPTSRAEGAHRDGRFAV